MATRVEELTEQLKHHLKAARDITEQAANDNDRDLTDDERKQVYEHFEKAKEAKDGLSKAKADEQTKDAIRELGDEIGLDESGLTAQERGEKAAANGLWTPNRRKSVGTHFTESDQYKSLIKSAPAGGFTKDVRVQSNPVGYKQLVTGTDDDSGGVFVEPDRRGMVDGPDRFFRPLTLRQLVTNGTTNSDQIDFTRITGISSNAQVVPEATSAEAGATTEAGGYKPQSGFTAGRDSTNVRTIAHWIPVTKRALSDAAQIRTLIDNFLQIGLEEELEDQMIAGDGAGENFEGLRAVSGTQTQESVGDPAGKPEGLGKLLALRRAKTKVERGGRATPNGYVINPSDAEALDEITNNDGVFYFNGPAGSNNSTPLWDLPVIKSEAATVGEAWVGDWTWAILWDREQASITLSDSHSDFFVRNLVAILAEMRAAFAIIRPAAFCRIDLSAAAA